MAALSPWMWFVGFAALLGLTIAFPNPILIAIVLFGGLELWRRWRERNSPEARQYYAVSTRDRLFVAAAYITIVALLAFGMTETHIERDFGDV
jgi:hypothetical protein